nr:MAG TPA: protein of unknown function (DUF5351) [Caudoviricetes sp.]
MLSDARDFIDRFSDVIDGDYGTSEPNAAMVMVHEINATIDHLSAPTAPVEASGSGQLKARATHGEYSLHNFPDDPDADHSVWSIFHTTESGGLEVASGMDRATADLLLAALSTTPARAEAQDEGAEMTRLLKLADAALANVTAFEDDARYIMGNTNYAITENARSEIRMFLLAQRTRTSVRPEALERSLSILDRLLDHSGARGSFDAMKHGDAVKDAEELLRSARSPGHTDLMVTPESIDAYMKDNPMEAQDEGAAGEREQTDCKRCAGNGEIVTDWDRYLGAPQPRDQGDEGTTDCPDCDGTGKVDVTEDHPSPTPAADADRVRIAVEALEWIDSNKSIAPVWVQRKVRDTLAALKSNAAKEGGKS